MELAESVGLEPLAVRPAVVIPGALPGFFVGLRLAVTGSWLVAVVLEQINATSGLGYMMFQAQNYGQTDVILVGLVVYGIFGFASDELVRAHRTEGAVMATHAEQLTRPAVADRRS